MTEQPKLQPYQRLVADRIKELRGKSSAEKLMSKRAYGLFGSVVHYADFLQGISCIIMDGTQAVADIEVSAGHVGAEESSVTSVCDTVALDTFIQVAGLLINSSDCCIPEHVFVATGIDSAILSKLCDFDACKSWTVYAMFSPSSETTAAGDVFVLTKDGSIAMAVLGVRFTRLPIAKLERMLESANNNVSAPISTVPKPSPLFPAPKALPELTSDEDTEFAQSSASSDGEAPETPSEGGNDENGLKEIISLYTGAPAADIASDANMGDLGVDSLAAVELADDLKSRFGKDISSTDLMIDPAATLVECEALFSSMAERCGFTNYWTAVAPKQNELLLAYILEAFRAIGADVWRLATGTDDPVALLFGSSNSQRVLEDFYTNSPMLATLTELLVDIITRVVAGSGSNTVKIVEVGAGFGGTTKRLAAALESISRPVQYTFTDIASTLVRNAVKKLAKYEWMEFHSLNLEHEAPERMKGSFDIAIGTNCVHATKNRAATMSRIRELLNEDGFAVLSEVTQIIDWYDIVYGLLEGWWMSNDADYPLQPPESWMRSFTEAGFTSVTYSQGPTAEANSQRLLLASKKLLKIPLRAKPEIETVVYKEVDGVSIHADIYLPQDSSRRAMPVALLLHGGGHMTLSRKAIRPAQVSFLLANHVIPVSFDYRLCPEINLIDGPITDVRDAFYGPTDFESGDLDARRAEEYPERRIALDDIIKALPTRPITSYDAIGTTDTTGLGWVRPGDPRSELVLSLFKEGNGLPILLTGLSADSLTMPPSPSLVASISPLAHVRGGTYRVPTYLIHGTRDEIVPAPPI
ncbi:putative polyketide synthase protein [Neofusicoccum parvum UCRNP2]|uniref:Putative polyketide synthase protein n=1 Tax=Botryosphaeria parva (strain UCR-NP2) TaxID=1287680 RepID=R1E842_BOTPV|nr:putative polyketide synthase protein [Neofusicoccum parvum UCRNP2]